MMENRREAQRFAVSLYAERQEPTAAPIHIRNLSATGFLVCGDVLAGQGGILHASFRVHPASGEARVSVQGKVMHSHVGRESTEHGIMILGFGNPDEERAYKEYVLELAKSGSAQIAQKSALSRTINL
jgi:hypothetical protein